jgi:hypothetical protein
MKGTRESILEKIETWRLDPLAPRILWLADVAGSGKSTVAKEMEEKWTSKKCLAGCFFFSRSTENTRTPRLFFTTVAQQGLAQLDPTVRTAVAVGIRKLINPVSASFKQQCLSIFVEPLQATQAQLVLLLDAIDECEPEKCRQLLRILLPLLSNLPHLKLFITSRPETHIREELGEFLYQELTIRSDETSNLKDVELFMKQQLGKVPLTQNQRMQLVDHARGLFIWARTVCSLLKKFRGNNISFVNRILSQDFHEMNPIYRIALEQAIGSDTATETVETVMDTLRIIVAAYEPVTPKMINSFLNISDSMDIIRDLGSVLECGGPDATIQFLHPTFREFLLNLENGGQYYVDINMAHDLMTTRCLRIMEEELKYNVCMLRDRTEMLWPNYLSEQCLKHTSIALQYSCRFWASHIIVTQARLLPPFLITMIEDFFMSKLLDWAYMVSVQGSIDRALAMLRRLISVRLVSNSEHFLRPN